MNVSASEAKQKFGQIIDSARIAPVIVEKSGRESVVIMSIDRFRELQRLEDSYWIVQAEEGIKSGFVGQEKALQFLKGKSNE